MTHVWGTGTWSSDSWDNNTNWGTDDWGDFGWGTLSKDPPPTLANLLDNWPHETTLPENNDPAANVLEAVGTYMVNSNAEIEEAYEQRFLQTASNQRLEQLAREVGVQRQTAEVDEHLRFRALIQKAGTQADGSFDSIERLCSIIFGDEVDQISVAAQSGTPVVLFTIPQPLLDEIPLTKPELETELQRVFPASTPVEINTGDVLILGEDGNNGVGGKLV